MLIRIMNDIAKIIRCFFLSFKIFDYKIYLLLYLPFPKFYLRLIFWISSFLFCMTSYFLPTVKCLIANAIANPTINNIPANASPINNNGSACAKNKINIPRPAPLLFII